MPRHVDKILSDVALEYGTGGGFVYQDIYSVVPVNFQSDIYLTFTGAAKLRDDVDARRAAGTASKRVNIEDGIEATYSAVMYSLHDLITSEDKRNIDPAFRLEEMKTRGIMHKIQMQREIACAADVNNDAVVTQFANASAYWDSATSDPEADFDAADEVVEKACGFAPNHVLIPPAVSKVLKRHPAVRELRKNWDQTLLIDGGLPPVMWGHKVIIPGSLYNSANPGKTAVRARIWNQDAVFLFFKDPNASNKSVEFGKVFRVRLIQNEEGAVVPIGDMQGDSYQVATKRWFDDDINATKIEVSLCQDEVGVCAAAGYRIKDVLS